MFYLFTKFPIKIKDQGKRVGEISKMLSKHGSKIKYTEIYTIGLQSAVISFQKKHGLEPTGVVDKTTWKALRKKIKMEVKIA